jgi:hypothetical protein
MDGFSPVHFLLTRDFNHWRLYDRIAQQTQSLNHMISVATYCIPAVNEAGEGQMSEMILSALTPAPLPHPGRGVFPRQSCSQRTPFSHRYGIKGGRGDMRATAHPAVQSVFKALGLSAIG